MACAEAGRRLLAAAGLLLCATAGAQVGTTPPAAATVPGTVVPAVPLPAGQWTVAQLRQSFLLADADSNGALTRAEAQQLAILPGSFEALDGNKDGLLTRDEYERGAGVSGS